METIEVSRFNVMPRLKIEFRDRHAEHALPDYADELCDHQDHELQPGDTFRGTINWSVPASFVATGIIDDHAEVEIHYLERDHILVIVNHPDYLKAKQIQQERNP